MRMRTSTTVVALEILATTSMSIVARSKGRAAGMQQAEALLGLKATQPTAARRSVLTEVWLRDAVLQAQAGRVRCKALRSARVEPWLRAVPYADLMAAQRHAVRSLGPAEQPLVSLAFLPPADTLQPSPCVATFTTGIATVLAGTEPTLVPGSQPAGRRASHGERRLGVPSVRG